MRATERAARLDWSRFVPVVFVFFWSTGFIGAKLGTPYAPPGKFLAIRFALVVLAMLGVALVSRAPWPRAPAQWIHIAIAGVLIQAAYLGGVFSALALGMSSGVVALITGLQPILTAFGAALLLGERATSRQWAGLALGFAGVALVVSERITAAGLSLPATALGFFAVLSITVGTLYQKRFCAGFDLRTGSVVQFAAALIAILPLAAFETRPVEWTGEFIFAVGWLVLVLSIGAISLLAVLIRRGEATRVASLFYLVPAVTAVLAYAAFGETLSALALAGVAATVVGVALVTRG